MGFTHLKTRVNLFLINNNSAEGNNSLEVRETTLGERSRLSFTRRKNKSNEDFISSEYFSLEYGVCPIVK